MSRAPSSGPPLELGCLPWTLVREHLEEDPRLLLAVGTLEQHGPHLPLGTSLLLAERVVEEASERSRVLRAPPLPYGVAAETKDPYAGAASLQRKTLHRIVNELLAWWEDAEVEELILVTSNHYEPHLDALLMALTAESTTTVVDLRSIPAGDILDGDPLAEHGGELETSLVLHLAPDLVRKEAISDFVPDPGTYRKYVRGRRPTPPPDSEGVIGHPSRATAEKGALLFERYVSALCERVL